MARNYIKDSSGRTQGWIEEIPNGRRCYDGTGRLMGWYDRKTNKTYHASGRLASTFGDILVSLLGAPREIGQ
jgi:hypothetical protein